MDSSNPPVAISCWRSGCEEFVSRVIEGRTLLVCGQCALVINSLLSCPKLVDLPVSTIWSKSGQSDYAMKHQIALSKFKRKVKEDRSYESKIKRLSKKYK